MGATNSVAAVISPQFCKPKQVDLLIRTISHGMYSVTDLRGNIMFKVEHVPNRFRACRTLYDADGNPIITLQHKMCTAHERWRVFRGEGSESKDLLFCAKKSSIFQPKTKTELEVFAAANTKEDLCDFKVQGSWSDRCDISLGNDLSTIVAQTHEEQHQVLRVTVYPNVDQAFIVALVVILHEINEKKIDHTKAEKLLIQEGIRVAVALAGAATTALTTPYM